MFLTTSALQAAEHPQHGRYVKEIARRQLGQAGGKLVEVILNRRHGVAHYYLRMPRAAQMTAQAGAG
jgi:hypothetical protein